MDKIVKRVNNDGNLVASGHVYCVRPDEPFENDTLGEENIGVTVLDVFLGDYNDIMCHRKWPIAKCIFDGGHSLSDTINHFNSLPDAADANAHLGGRPKAPYRFIRRKTWTEEKLNLFTKKTLPNEIHTVNSQSCCLNKCIRLMRPEDTLFIRQKFWLKGFDEHREYARSVGGQFCNSGNNRKRKYVTLLGRDICATAWYKINGIPKSTFHEYMDQYKKGIVSSTHGNKDVKRPRLGTVQALVTITAIINDSTDYMPNQMRITVLGRMDTLKFLPSGHSWKKIQTDATKVLLCIVCCIYLITCIPLWFDDLMIVISLLSELL